MATVASQSLKKPTYQETIDAALTHHGSVKKTLGTLAERVNISLDTLGTLSAALSGKELGTFLQGQYENYDAVQKEQTVAKEALEKCTEALRRCTPAQVALNPERVEHMEALGYDMSQYPQKEVELAQASGQLETLTSSLQRLVDKTESYITAIPGVLDSAARKARQESRKEPTYGDKVPDTLGGAKGYFLKGLRAYHASLSTDSTPTTKTSPPTELQQEGKTD